MYLFFEQHLLTLPTLTVAIIFQHSMISMLHNDFNPAELCKLRALKIECE